MTYHGHIKNGQIALDGPVHLPEGTEVSVNVLQSADGIPSKPVVKNGEPQKFRPIRMPGGSLSDELVRDRR